MGPSPCPRPRPPSLCSCRSSDSPRLNIRPPSDSFALARPVPLARLRDPPGALASPSERFPDGLSFLVRQVVDAGPSLDLLRVDPRVLAPVDRRDHQPVPVS